MSSRPEERLTSCLPCSKRKVKCDRQQPCNHCQRRRRDICEYPGTVSAISRSSRDVLRLQQQRIEHLEQHIRQMQSDAGSGRSPPTVTRAIGDDCILSPGPSQNLRSATKTTEVICELDASSPVARRLEGSLIEHEEQTTYVDAPGWYGWDETKSSSDARGTTIALIPVDGQSKRRGYERCILDISDTPKSYWPPADIVQHLWRTFLNNVHPVCKLFFDWDVERTIQRASQQSDRLSAAESCLLAAVFFIATLSMTGDECQGLFGGLDQPSILHHLRGSTEIALLNAGYATSSDLRTLQALLLYILAMRNQVEPAMTFSLVGVAVRIAQRLGLHRDGVLLDLPPIRAEERRRVWWFLQHLEILASQLIGCISLTLFSSWDTRLPLNLDDDDFKPNMDCLPPTKSSLTSMSICMWRYEVLDQQRRHWSPESGMVWGASNFISLDQKKRMMSQIRQVFSEKYLQHCEMINPLHVQVQIGLQGALLALHRAILQPKAGKTRLSEMPTDEREELYQVCIKGMEYWLLSQTNASIAHFRWHNESYFQWTAFILLLIEVERRAETSEVSNLWELIDRVCELHPKIKQAADRPEVDAVRRLILVAWPKRLAYLNRNGFRVSTPSSVLAFSPSSSGTMEGDKDVQDTTPWYDPGMQLDLDLINWDEWEAGNFTWPEVDQI